MKFAYKDCQHLVSSIKAEVKKKSSPAAGIFLASQPMNEPRSVVICRTRCPVAGMLWPSVLGFLYQRFSLLDRNEACQFRKPANQNGGQMATIVLSGTRGPWLFLVIREGLESRVKQGARGTQRLTNQLRLALEPECLENPTAPPEKMPRMERTRSETLKLFVVSDVGRRSTPLSSIRSERSWQFFVPRSSGHFWPDAFGRRSARTPGTDRVCWKR